MKKMSYLIYTHITVQKETKSVKKEKVLQQNQYI